MAISTLKYFHVEMTRFKWSATKGEQKENYTPIKIKNKKYASADF